MTNTDDNNRLPPDLLLDSSVPPLQATAAPPSVILPEGAPEVRPPVYPQFSEDLRVPWGWLDLFLLVGFALVGAFLVSIFLVGVFATFGFTPSTLQNSTIDKSFFLIANQALISLGLLAYLAVQIRVRFHSPFWRTIGWRPLETGALPRPLVYLSLIFGGFSISLVVQFASAALQTKAKLPIQEYFQDTHSALLLMLMSILLAPLVEETIFRGYVYPVLARSLGVGTGVVITGTLFGLVHAPQLWGGWGQILLLIGVGIIFTAARAFSRTVVVSYLLHFSYNSFLLISFLIASHGLRHFPAAQ